MMDALTNVIVVIIYKTCMSNHHVYTLNLYTVICQSYLNEVGGRVNEHMHHPQKFPCASS